MNKVTILTPRRKNSPASGILPNASALLPTPNASALLPTQNIASQETKKPPKHKKNMTKEEREYYEAYINKDRMDKVYKKINIEKWEPAIEAEKKILKYLKNKNYKGALKYLDLFAQNNSDADVFFSLLEAIYYTLEETESNKKISKQEDFVHFKSYIKEMLLRFEKLKKEKKVIQHKIRLLPEEKLRKKAEKRKIPLNYVQLRKLFPNKVKNKNIWKEKGKKLNDDMPSEKETTQLLRDLRPQKKLSPTVLGAPSSDINLL